MKFFMQQVRYYASITEIQMSKDKVYLYGAREVATGKLVSNITNPRRKYWDKRGNAENAINYHNTKSPRYRKPNEPGPVELVKFELIEVTTDKE